MLPDLILSLLILAAIILAWLGTVSLFVLTDLIRASPVLAGQPDQTAQQDASEIYRVAFRSTDAPFETSHEYALGVVFEAGLKAGRRVEVTA